MYKKTTVLLSLLVIAALVMFAGCGGEEEPEETILEVTITAHPQGGVNIQSVDCTFEGEITSGDGPVQVTIEWWWEDEFGFNDQVVETDYHDFTEQQPVAHTTSFFAPLGFVLLNYYWVELSWTDDNGDHTLESTKAFFSATDGTRLPYNPIEGG